MGLWKLLMCQTVMGVVHEDNESTITVANNGYSPQLRHLNKHHRISLGLVHEFIKHDDVTLKETNAQKGDILTKGFNKSKHQSAMKTYILFWFICVSIGVASKPVPS